ncbi:MAG: hypothetical protein HZC36_00110 [Armatimonadetes bacterium]|nr:hypothetical protein [Armatimonadota bacterium]
MAVLTTCLALVPSVHGNQAAGIPFTVAAKPWPVDGLGHHRAIVRVVSPAETVVVELPWRRHDPNPEKKALVVVDLATGNPLPDVLVLNATPELGTVAFRPLSAPADYAIYTMPFRYQGVWGGADGNYLAPKPPTDAAWAERTRAAIRDLPRATLLRFEARTPFDSFAPMELAATREERDRLLRAHPEPYLAFPESREFPIRMRDALPYRWIQAGAGRAIVGKAQPNEYFAFQVGVFAARQSLENVKVQFSDLVGPGRSKIGAGKLTCFNLGGTNWDGSKLVKRVDVPQGLAQALWMGVDVGRSARPGTYRGVLTLKPENAPPMLLPIRLTVSGTILEDRGDSQPWRHSRLRWLNSTLGTADRPTPPYTPVQRRGHVVSCLGRQLLVGGSGLPQSLSAGPNSILRSPLTLEVAGDGGFVKTEPRLPVEFVDGKGKCSWKSVSVGASIDAAIVGNLEFDGHVNLRVQLRAKQDLHLKDLALVLPFHKGSSTYFMGLGRAGGFAPEAIDWRWQGPFDSFWMGDVHRGLHVELRGGSYHGPMLNLFRPAPPASWSNGGKGGVMITRDGGEATARLYTGERTLRAGESLELDLALLITPVKPIDTAWHFRTRFYHNPFEYAPKPEAIEAGANVVNVHHANDINPYINYPFLAVPKMKAFVDAQHRAGRKVKIYDTIRELTNYTTEIWALRSLGNEIFTNGGGGGFAWLQEHLGTGYIPSWYQPYVETGTADASIVTAGFSRWINYYIEGLAWLAKNVGIDGIYLDDVTFDRRVLMRMRRVLAMGGREPMMDLHSNTGFSIGPANQYTEFFPFVDRLWFGESFNYDAMPPEQWLVEVSGIPFGLMGEMLQGGGNKWLGMVFGMATRYGWTTENVMINPDPLWKFWDRFGIDKAKMIGYWEPGCPVRTDKAEVKATAYLGKGRTLVAIGNFGGAEARVQMTLDWKALGIDPKRAVLRCPEIEGFQKESILDAGQAVILPPKRGLLIWVQ